MPALRHEGVDMAIMGAFAHFGALDDGQVRCAGTEP